MEITLAANQVDCYEQIGTGSMVTEETAECVVSDLLPDIAGILDTDGRILIQTKSADPGRISVTATVAATVLYRPDDGTGIRRIPVSIPCSAVFEMADMDEQCLPVVHLELESLDARLLNPRKILVRAAIRASAECYRVESISLPHAIQEPQGAEQKIRTLDAVCEFMRVTGVREKTFVVTEETKLPAVLPPVGELLKSRMDAVVEDVKPVGNKLILKGSVRTTHLYAAMDSGELCAYDTTTTFSQILELDTVPEDPMAEISLMSTAVYTELLDNAGERRHIGLELHFVAQVVCRELTRMPYIADAYDPARPLTLETQVRRFSGCLRPLALRESVRELMETQNSVQEVLHVYATPGTVTVSDRKIMCPVHVQILYRSESGEICRGAARYTLESMQESEETAEIVIHAVRCGEVYAAAAAGGIELRIPVEIFGELTKEHLITAVSGVAYDEAEAEEKKERPSLYLLYADPLDTVWSLAKRYGSTPELIREVNAMEAEEEPGQRMLLIPRSGI